MAALHVAIIGFGNLGRACATAMMNDKQFVLSGIVRRQACITEKLAAPFNNIPVVSHISELKSVDAALICVPVEQVEATAHDLLQHGIAIVECASFHDEAMQRHKQEMERMVAHFRVPAIIGAGWDPGALSLFRGLFALLTPHGHTETSRRPGVSLHHTTIARSITGVKDALTTELHLPDGKLQRYVYVELEQGIALADIETAIQSDPQFLGVETLLFQVDSVAALEDEGHGVLLERRGTTGVTPNQLLLLEARFSELALCARIMLAAALALPGCKKQAYSLFDLPLGSLWGELRHTAESEWL